MPARSAKRFFEGNTAAEILVIKAIVNGVFYPKPDIEHGETHGDEVELADGQGRKGRRKDKPNDELEQGSKRQPQRPKTGDEDGHH